MALEAITNAGIDSSIICAVSSAAYEAVVGTDETTAGLWIAEIWWGAWCWWCAILWCCLIVATLTTLSAAGTICWSVCITICLNILAETIDLSWGHWSRVRTALTTMDGASS